MNLSPLFPDEDYRFALRFERGLPEDFFAPTESGPRLLAERRRWLASEPNDGWALHREGEPLLDETLGLLRSWPATREAVAGLDIAKPKACAELGRSVEPDFLLLRRDDAGAFRLRAGCVCFPSSWNLAEKMGHTLEEIHGVVPGLNSVLARPISGFLERMPAGLSWLRANWGLSRSSELNQHPSRNLPRLDATVRRDEVWLRVERQALVALAQTGGVLFGIRVEVFGLEEVLRDAAATAGFARALRTMSEAMAAYKGIAPARERILSLVRDGHS